MDGFIAMLPEPFQKFSSHMDFPGQKAAERTFQVILVISGIIGFFVGYYYEQLSYAIYTVLGATVFSALLVLPPWPFLFRKNPVQWLPLGSGKKSKTTEDETRKEKRDNDKKETKKTK